MNKMFYETMNWNLIRSTKCLKIYVITSIVVLIIGLLLTGQFIGWLEGREGVALEDPILSLFAPMELSILTFVFIYGSTLTGIISLSFQPRRLVLACNAYTIILCFRIITMYLTPLNPPATIIYLDDPIVEFFTPSDITTKDLFFSGHTATIFLLFLTAVNKKLRIFFMVCGIIIILFILLQHAHYTVDVVSAFPFTYLALKISDKIDYLVVEKNLEELRVEGDKCEK